MRRRQYTIIGLVVFLTLCAYSILRIPNPPEAPYVGVSGEKRTSPSADDSDRRFRRQPPHKRPKSAPGTESHPIWHLMSNATREFEEVRGRQSKTLKEAVTEYRRRHGIPPPPHFDKWYEFAKANGVQMIDEFDMIHEMITPFWGLKPKTIRLRAKEALGHDNFLLALLIRDHEVTHVQGGHEWQREATEGMVGKFIQYLPSMDLAFNIHDEPRVMVPHDDMTRLIKIAKEVNMPKANAEKRPENNFMKKARDLSSGHGIDEVKLTRFNEFAHQATWTHSRMSCSPDSPARSLEDDDRHDDASQYGLSELGFVYNITALSDICLSPSLSETYGFFDRPNAYNVVHDLIPVFSQSKISSYADILYPSPWYWYEKVEYDEKRDKAWGKKEDQLYWRGSTTGGFSRDGTWRRQHRQHFVQKINAKGRAKIYENDGDETQPRWRVKEVPRGDYKDAINVHFSHIGQCDQGDCEAQIQYFDVKERADQQDAWGYKFLLDMDGNAFSGRFYAFLRSQSLTFKFSIFREWHFEWLKPWVHYIPLSLRGDDWLESVRFFRDGGPGSDEAARIALESREWASKVLRKEDMEVWFFRLLLEYGRVIDDNREKIGFSLGEHD